MALAGDNDPGLFHPPGMRAWDNWFAKEGNVYHAFYLEQASCAKEPLDRSHVGHASSTDLIHWTNHGPVLVAEKNTWNDRHIATGSAVKHDGKWWMVFTGYGTKTNGVGIAVSDDLMTWKKVGNGPVAPLGEHFDAVWEGKPLKWFGIADPYIYPEPVDSWFYMIINAGVVDAPIGLRGCIASMRSRDLKTWEPVGILSWPQWFERMETPQLWQRDGRWYLYFGGAHDAGLPPEKFVKEAEALTSRKVPARQPFRGNYVFMSDRFEGPYVPSSKCWLDMRGYIIKVIPGPDGKDVLIITQDRKISRPYPVTYAPGGSLVIGKPLGTPNP